MRSPYHRTIKQSDVVFLAIPEVYGFVESVVGLIALPVPPVHVVNFADPVFDRLHGLFEGLLRRGRGLLG